MIAPRFLPHRIVFLATAILPVCTLLAQASNLRRTPEVEVVQRVSPAVVNIHSERTVHGPASEDLFAMTPSQNRINGMGTGVIIDPRGYIVTNQHVVEDVNVIRVRLADRNHYIARILARDAEADLALLKIDAVRPLPTAPLGTVKDLMIGERVVAIGNAYGYEHSVSTGIVSALNRDVTLNKEVSYKALIQTDAAINPGNSGGPLCNIDGEVVGINVAIRAGAQGISFAIPVDTMIKTVSEMMSIRKRNGTWHGLVCRDRVDIETASSEPVQINSLTSNPKPLGAPTSPVRSLVVERTEANGPGADAGLQAGDVLVQVADSRVACSLDLERALLDHAAGDRVPVVIRRDGEQKRLELVLATADQAAPSSGELIWRKLGMKLRPVSRDAMARAYPQLQGDLHGGMTVTEVRADSTAFKAGIQRGDILVGLHLWETLSLENVLYVLNHQDLATFIPLRFYIVRSGQVHRGWLQQID